MSDFSQRRRPGFDRKRSPKGGRWRSTRRGSDSACGMQDPWRRGEVRDAIRAQPITAALVVFALGYLFGRLGALIPSRH